MRGGSLTELQELPGHKTLTMGYAHLSQKHKKKAVNLLNGLTAPKVVKSKCHIFKIQYFKGWVSY